MNAIRHFLLLLTRLPGPIALAALLCLAVAASASASLPAPFGKGSLDSQAEVVFYIEDDPSEMRIRSNMVSVQMTKVRALAFSAADEVRVQAGQSFSIPLMLRNMGNIQVSYTLAMQGAPNGTVALLPDVDGNGQKNEHAHAIDLTQSRHLDYAGQDAFLLTGIAPPDAAAGSRYTIIISAAGLPGAAVAANMSLILVVDAAPQTRVSLEASRHTLDIFDTTTVTARIANTGKQALAKDTTVVIDGRPAQVTLLRYRIPAGMRYAGGNAVPSGTDATELLFAKSGAAEFDYVRTPPEDILVREIAIALKQPLQPGQSRQLTFALRRALPSPVSKQEQQSPIASRAEAYDSVALQPIMSNFLMLSMGGQTSSPDLAPFINQSDTGRADASTWIEIGVKNIGGAATEGAITLHGEVPFALGDGDLKALNWQCSIRRNGAGSAFECASTEQLPAGGDMPPILINAVRSATETTASNGGMCGPDKKITVAVSVPNEARDLRGNNRAEALLLCKNGAAISGRAWLDASNDGVYQHGETPLSGWRAQLLRGGQVVNEAETDQSGQYRIAGVTPDRGYSLRFMSPQGRLEAPPIDGLRQAAAAAVASSPLQSTLDFANAELLYGAFLTGQEYPQQNLALLPTGLVFNQQTGQPIANAKVTLKGPEGMNPRRHLVGGSDNATTVTDEKGRFNFFLTPDAPAGIYRMVVQADGYEMPRIDDVLTLNEHPAAADAGRVQPAHKVFRSPEIPKTSQADNLEAGSEARRGNGYFIMNRVQGAKKVVNNHLGMDPLLAGGELRLQKTADRKTVELIDFFHYTLKISHHRATAFGGFTIDDSLPRGLRYVPGSARLIGPGDAAGNEGGSALPDPSIRDGRSGGSSGSGGISNLNFDFSGTPLLPNVPMEIRYRVAVGATAAEGAKLVSYATAQADAETARASAAIRISGGVFSDDAFVLGKVFLDCDGDGVQGADEPGVPGVRIYLEDGAFAETDRHGKYSLYGLKPTTHVLKMDTLTLPASARAQVLSHRHAGRGDLRFLDLRNGELGRGDFALSCSPAIQAEVTYRREQLADAGDELDRALKLRFDAEIKAEERQQTIQGDRASGWIGDGAAKRNEATTHASTSTSESASTSASARATESVAPSSSTAAAPELDTLLRGDTALRIVGLQDGQILSSDFTDVTVLGSNAGVFTLTVNGVAVPQTQVGQRSALASRQAAAWTYIAVRLRSGKNTLAVEQHDGGQVRRSHIDVIVPGPAARIVVTAPPQLIADGKSAVALSIALFDKDGVPATAASFLSLHAGRADWITPDANPDARGQQILIKDGRATVLLKAPAEAGSMALRAELGTLEQTMTLSFAPALRPMIAAGIVEGMVTLNSGKIETGRGNNGFERELRTFTRGSADGKQTAAGRTAFFLKGQVKGDYLLTAAFDSDKEARQKLFRDIEPDKYYPVYGDDSQRGFDAQASSKLYLRIDKERSYLVLGDFNTAQTDQVRQLTQYNRAVNGVRHHLEQGPLVANVFASRDNLRQQVITFAAANTRFYPGKLPAFFVEGSERVEVITYDRAQGGIGQRVKTLARFSDYTIDELSGSLKVVDAVTRIDPETGGENVYRITFEVEDGAAQSWLYGGDVTLSPTHTTKLGVMAVNDDNPNQPRQLQGVFGSWQIGPKTSIDGEVARTTLGQDLTRSSGSGNNNGANALSGDGTGWRMGAKHGGERLQAELAMIGTSDAFSNLSAPVAGGRFEARAKSTYKIDDKTRIKSEALRTRDRLAGGGARYGSSLDQAAGLSQNADGVRYTGLLLGVERDLGAGVTAEIGTRVVQGELNRHSASGQGLNAAQSKQDIDLMTIRTRIASPAPGLPMASIYGEYEQDVRERDKRALALGMDYALPSQGRLYARHEIISSLGSAYEIEENARSYRTLVGIEGDYMEGGQAFSEYRGARPLTGRGPETAYGTRNRWQLNEQLNVRSSFERTRSMAGDNDGRGGSEASSISTVLEYRHSAQLKGTTGLDVRVGQSDTSYLHTLGVGYRIDEEWTMLGKNAFYLVRGKGEGNGARDTLRMRQRIGLAYRQQRGSGLNGLGYYEHRAQRSSDRGLDNEDAHIVSLHAHVQPARHWELSGRYAGKHKTMKGRNGDAQITGHLLSGRVTRDIGKRWDAGLAASMFADSLGQRKQAFGVEAGYMVKDDLWLSAGYNAVGFTDRDFAGMADTAQGVYFRIRYKFDENSF